MSNHSASYLLNYVLQSMEEYNLLEDMLPESRQKFIAQIVHHARCDYDCNNHEILERIGEKYNICSRCLKTVENLDGGLCKACWG